MLRSPPLRPPLCSKHVGFGPRLKMNTRWLAGDSRDRGAEYELVATVTHHGKTIGAGHYTADVKQPGDKCAGGGAGRLRGAWAGEGAAAAAGAACRAVCGAPAPTRLPLPTCRWMRFDDGQVCFVSQQQVLVQRPYLLFYQRAA